MSYNVLIIPEDFTKDEHILKPLVEKIFQEINHRANVRVCRNPRLTGLSQCMNYDNISHIISMYPMVDLYLLLVDRDGDENRRIRLNNLENRVNDSLTNNKKFMAENFYQEVEVIALAGQTLPTEWSWQDVRQEPNPKEKYFIPFTKLNNYYCHPYNGRKLIMQRSLLNWRRMRSLCPEDVETLISRIGTIFNT
ncbi:MAG TPA: hypothetical protein VHP31_04835 [Caproicibacter sp.]|nr:hypothetical protein [Caproicibacter sp.]